MYQIFFKHLIIIASKNTYTYMQVRPKLRWYLLLILLARMFERRFWEP
jgi:hypothetical protein